MALSAIPTRGEEAENKTEREREIRIDRPKNTNNSAPPVGTGGVTGEHVLFGFGLCLSVPPPCPGHCTHVHIVDIRIEYCTVQGTAHRPFIVLGASDWRDAAAGPSTVNLALKIHRLPLGGDRPRHHRNHSDIPNDKRHAKVKEGKKERKREEEAIWFY